MSVSFAGLATGCRRENLRGYVPVIPPTPHPPPPGVTSETDVTIHSHAQLLQNTHKNVVFTLLFAASVTGK